MEILDSFKECKDVKKLISYEDVKDKHRKWLLR